MSALTPASFRIRDRDDRVVEGGLDVRVAVVHDPLFTALLERLLLGGSSGALLASAFRRRRRVDGFDFGHTCSFQLSAFSYQ